MDGSTTSRHALGRHGPFADSVAGFTPRPAQQRMAESIEDAFSAGTSLITEAGTGTGKTFAYLVPAILAGGKVIVSTGTRNLQDQLFHRDIPRVRDVLRASVATALLKGRANYLCLYRLDRNEAKGRYASREEAGQLVRIREWAHHTSSGEIAEVTAIPENAPVWREVTSTTDNCLGQDCPAYSDCHLVLARRAAQEADLVVVNHHLLCADLALKDDGVGELLPYTDTVIIDEAHQLPDIASIFFGQSITMRQLQELARDARVEVLSGAVQGNDLLRELDQLDRSVHEFRLAFGRHAVRAALHTVENQPQVKNSIKSLRQCLDEIQHQLEPLADGSKGLDSCWRRSEDFGRRLDLLADQDAEDAVRWFEARARGLTLHRTPLDISGPFRSRMDNQGGSWIFTSATLAVGESFEHFQHRLGLEDIPAVRWQSPFDYPGQALLYQPGSLPQPGAEDYVQRMLEVVQPVLEASQGRAFLLFTSHRALQQAATMLQDSLPFPLLVQGSAPRAELLDRFREMGNAVLLGTSSFWEGVDVRGAALSCVIIDKLPFATPDDPVLQARMHACTQRGGKPFMEYQLPTAVISLKQGVGRLIRDENDHGVLVLCDPRLDTRGYGRVFLDSLPPMTRTRQLGDVQAFFAHYPQQSEGLALS